MAAALVVGYEPCAAFIGENLPPDRVAGFFADKMDFASHSSGGLAWFFRDGGGEKGGDGGAEAGPEAAPAMNPEFENSSLRSSSALMAELGTGKVFLSKNSGIRAYPASLTKLMTVLLALEYLPALPETIVLDEGMFPELYRAEASMAGFLPGEEVKTMDLIYGAMLASGAECSVALAAAVAGSEESFAYLMNERAQGIGMSDTHFVNATGLHDPEHFSTAKDMAKLLATGLQNERFHEIFTCAEHMASPTDKRPDGWLLENDAFPKMDGGLSGGRVLGAKAGYTPEAGQCLASMAEKGGRRFIFVSMGSGAARSSQPYSFEDALNAYENAML
jgi:D-alanyl-D-alanine carboxypeptidase (penicillin-binding protein 5/6)